MNSRAALFFGIGAGVVVGAAVDFIFGGVLKIIWFLIYTPAYFVIAHTISTWLRTTRWAALASKSLIAIFCAALLNHLLWSGYHRDFTYEMVKGSDSPISFRSGEWPQVLFVSGPKLEAALGPRPLQDKVRVTVSAVMDYGCIRSFKLVSIGDFILDPDASWAWKTDKNATTPEQNGPGSEDQKRPWCKIKFYGY
jgi:hypothetical protein